MKGFRCASQNSPISAEKLYDRPTTNSPRVPINRVTSITSRMSKRGHIKSPSFGGVIVKGPALSSHVRVISSIPSSREIAIACRTTDPPPKNFNPEEFLNGMGELKAFSNNNLNRPNNINAFGAFMKSLVSLNSNMPKQQPPDLIRVATASQPRPAQKIAPHKMPIQNNNPKPLTHIGVLLGAIKAENTPKTIKHIKKGSINYIATHRGKTSQGHYRDNINWGVTGKRYSPTAQYLAMKKVDILENKEVNNHFQTSEITKSENTFTLFTESFRYFQIFCIMN